MSTCGSEPHSSSAVDCKKAFVILTIAFVTRVATVDQNSPLWQPVQHTWSTGTAEVVTRAGRHQCYTQQKGIVPLQRALTAIC